MSFDLGSAKPSPKIHIEDSTFLRTANQQNRLDQFARVGTTKNVKSKNNLNLTYRGGGGRAYNSTV